MPDPKTKESAKKPKVRSSGFVLKQAASIIREKYQQQKERNAPEQKDPARYATDKIENGSKRTLRAADAIGRTIRKKIKAERQQRRREKHAQNTGNSQGSGQPQSQQATPQEPPELLPGQTSAETAPAAPALSDAAGNFSAAVQEHVQQHIRQPDTPFTDHADFHSSAPDHWQQHIPSNESPSRFPTPDSRTVNESLQGREKNPAQSKQAAAQGRQKAIGDAKKARERKVEQQRFTTRDQTHRAETIGQQNFRERVDAIRSGSEQALGGSRTDTFTTLGKSGAKSTPEIDSILRGLKKQKHFEYGASSAGRTRYIQSSGLRPKQGTSLQKKTPAKRIFQKRVSPAQRAKAAAQKKAQREMARKGAQQTARVTKAVGKLTVRAVVAVGRAVVAAVRGLIAACSSVVVLIVLVCLLLIAAIAASPFGIFFSGEGSSADSVPLSVAIGQISFSFNQTLADLQNDETYDDVTITGSAADWVEVIAVFAVKTAGSNDADATDVVILNADRIDRLEAVFWDMTAISQEVREIEHPGTEEEEGWTETILDITITAKSAEEMAAEYDFTEQQLEMLRELLDNRAMIQDLIGNLGQITADAEAVLDLLPEDITLEREGVVRAACSLVGKVGYFWGGKSYVLGWDSRWGQLLKVTAAGSVTTGNGISISMTGTSTVPMRVFACRQDHPAIRM
ncbi:hypothetical protein ACTQ33_16555 [Candidatus Avoscillospira sp. LCP25S3_F1]|uniref:hypothetical protein n=1 Tax=Candidatus Avoscillospira sp. LCP25S3_F1 TaxID=3438825 RepID=UPI003F929EA2